MEGFLILLQRFLKERFSRSGLNVDYLFVATKTNIIVHGPNRKLLGDTDILAKITSAESEKEVIIHPIKGTAVDLEIIKDILKETLQPDMQVVIGPQKPKETK